MLGDQVRAFGGHLQPRGASPPCGDSAFEATVQRRDRTCPGQDRSGPASLAFGGGPGLYKPSGLRGLFFIGFVIVELLILLCTYGVMASPDLSCVGSVGTAVSVIGVGLGFSHQIENV